MNPALPFPSLHAAITHAAESRPDKVALVHEGGEVTYRQFIENIENVARHLVRLGIGEGERFAIYGQNTPEHYYSFYAASLIGAMVVPLNPHLTASEVEYSFRHSEAKFLFFDNDVEANVAQAGLPAEKVLRVSILRENAPAVELPAIETDPEADFVISYSSGTTGTPKAVMLDQASMIRVGEAGARMWGVTERDIATVGLPLGYMYGLNTSSSPVLHRGGTIVLMRRFHPGEALEIFSKQNATLFMGVPTMFTMMLSYCEQKGLKYEFPAMRMLVTAGAPLPPEVSARFIAAFGKPLSNYYGLSEAFPIFGHYAEDEGRIPEGATGRLAPGAYVEIRRPDGSRCEPGEPGEAFVRGAATMKRYNKEPEMTAAAMADGLFRTGDIVSVDEARFFTIQGRIKEIIIRGGHNIAPAEVEQVLVSHGAVIEATVVGAPDPVFGEKPVAFIVRRPGAEVTAEELISHAEAQLSEFKVPRTINFLNEMPLGKTGKVDRRALQALATSGL